MKSVWIFGIYEYVWSHSSLSGFRLMPPRQVFWIHNKNLCKPSCFRWSDLKYSKWLTKYPWISNVTNCVPMQCTVSYDFGVWSPQFSARVSPLFLLHHKWFRTAFGDICHILTSATEGTCHHCKTCGLRIRQFNHKFHVSNLPQMWSDNVTNKDQYSN